MENKCLYNSNNLWECDKSKTFGLLCNFHSSLYGIPRVIIHNGNHYTFKYEIKDSLIPNIGKGLFLSHDSIKISKNSLIYIYSGNLVQRSEYKGDGSYVLQVQPDLFIDAEDKINLPGRFINDYRNSEYKPNCEFISDIRVIYYGGRIFNTSPILAIRNILPGEEFIIDYGDEYWIDINN